MTAEENKPDTDELLRSKAELEKRLEDSQKTILSLETKLGDISRTLEGVLDIAKTMYPEAYEEYMKKKQNTEQEN